MKFGDFMNIQEAEEKCALIEQLAHEIENDDELKELEPRYRIMAEWINSDIVKYLTEYNLWRRYDGDLNKAPKQLNQTKLGKVIDAAIDALKNGR